MSDQPLNDDELASALLDGEADAAVPSDGAVTARVDELRAAALAIAAPVTVDPVEREQAIAAALAVFDAADSASSDVGAPTPLRRTPQRPVGRVLLGAAAAVLVLLGAVALVTRDDPQSSVTASDAPAEGGAATTASAAAGLDALAPTPPSPSTSASADRSGAAAAAESASAPDLGDVDETDALRAALDSDRFANDAVVPTTCEAEARAASPAVLGPLADAATLRWKGQPARVLVFVDETGASHLVVVAEPTCEVLDRIG